MSVYAKFCHECMGWRSFEKIYVRELKRLVWVCRACGSELDEILENLRIGDNYGDELL